MATKIAPLSSSFMLTSILGFIISAIWVFPNSPSWGTAFVIVFAMMFIASVISMTYGPVEVEMKMDSLKRLKRK